MKLLRDFIRLRTAGLGVLRVRHDAPHRPWTVTVPKPLLEKNSRVTIDMHWHADVSGGRPVARWHRHLATKASDHLQRIARPSESEDGPWAALPHAL